VDQQRSQIHVPALPDAPEPRLAARGVLLGHKAQPGGDSWVYQFRYDTGTYMSTAPGQIVGQKITGAPTVGVVIIGLPGGGLKDITTDATGTKRLFGVNIGGNAGAGKRSGWREISK